MGWRFRKSVKLFPGVRLNISKSGISTTLGSRGSSVNFGKRGTRATVSALGTGVSYSTLLSGGGTMQSKANPVAKASSGKISGAGWAVAGLLALLAIGRCAPATTDSTATGQGSASAIPQYVTARSLNCRADPKGGATVVRALARGQSVNVAEESGGWSKISGALPCWASSDYLSASAPAALELIGGQRPMPALAGGSTFATGSNSGDSGAAMTAAGAGAAAAVAGRSLSPKSRGSRSARARRVRGSSGGGYSDSSCPCSGGNICIGPRGGRYCITSGGNKRYGV